MAADAEDAYHDPWRAGMPPRLRRRAVEARNPLTVPPALQPWHDVAIAGGGLAGASLAVRLARAGASVIVFDPGRFPRDKLCGEFLSAEAGPVLERLGVGDVLAAGSFEPIEQVRLTTPRGGEVVVGLMGADGRPGIGLSRRTLDARLVTEARAAGATVIEGATARAALIEQGRVVGLRAQGADGEPIEVRASITVAANGRNSALVRQTGVVRRRGGRSRPRLAGLKRHFLQAPTAGEPQGTVSLHLVPGGYGGTCRVEDDSVNFCALVPEAWLRRQRGDLEASARETFGRNQALADLLTTSEPTGPWKTVAGVRVEAARHRVPGIAFAGDCRGTVDPLGGQGMTMALLGAELLSECLLSSLARRDGTFESSDQRRYEAAWHRRFNRRIDLCRLFHHVLVRPDLVDLLARRPRWAARLLAMGFHATRDDVRC